MDFEEHAYEREWIKINLVFVFYAIKLIFLHQRIQRGIDTAQPVWNPKFLSLMNEN